MLIYILEDDNNIREIESYTLKNSGYEVMDFSAPSLLYTALMKQIPDLLILDVMLPEKDGLSILQNLKSDPAYADIPVIVISAKTTELDRVKGLEFGAEDYICKPFGVMELVSRVKVQLRNVRKKKDYSYFGIMLSEKERTVFVDDKKIELTYKEFELLKLLISKPKMVFGREVISESIWGYDNNLSRTLDIHINTLRKKLGKKGRYIITVRNVGYKLEKEKTNET